MDKDKKAALLYARKRTLFGLPLSFTKYYFFKEKMIVKTGFFRLREEEIRLYRVLDITLNRSFGQRIFGLGTIHLCTADKTTPELDIMSIKKSKEAKELVSELVEKCREEKKITARELMGDSMDDFDEDAH